MRPSTFYLPLIALLALSGAAEAQSPAPCQEPTAACIADTIRNDISSIEESRWRDYAYRDFAISMAYGGRIDEATSLIKKIENPDTQAMTIRAIGMALAIHKDLSAEEYKIIFAKLDSVAKIISHEGARDIAYTYIAMAQAFAGLDEDATKTTAEMKKPELKHKAFGETAEIQAERGDYNAALKSINLIDSLAFRNKALGTVSDIFVKRKEYDKAFMMASQITNPTKKTTALQHILDAQLGLESYDKNS